MVTVDTIGLRCPEPLMIVKRELRKIASGESLCIYADDPSTMRDFKLLCNHLGHTLLQQSTLDNNTLVFIIQKK